MCGSSSFPNSNTRPPRILMQKDLRHLAERVRPFSTATCGQGRTWIFMVYHLLFNSSPWKPWPIEIDGLPSYKMVIFHGYVSHNQMVILNHYFNMLNWKMKKNDAKCKEYLYSIKNDSSFRWRLLRGVRLYRILVLVLRPELIQQKWIKAERSKGVQIIQTNIP